MKPNWLDRITAPIAPGWTFRRQKSRLALAMLARHFEGAGAGRRHSGWRSTGADANAANGPALMPLRERARDLVRNNPWAESALSIIANHTVGTGIVAKPSPTSPQALSIWKQWAETTACDADGRNDFYGLQKLIVRTVVESGEVLVRKRIRFLDEDGTPEGGLPLPLQLQVLDPDFLDTSKDTVSAAGGRRIIQGVQFNQIGQREGYWLFREHPGSSAATAGGSVFVPADSVLHIFRALRPGQVRGPSWFAPVLLRFKDFDEFEDATLMKQKIAACLAVITSDSDGTNAPLGTGDPNDTIDSLEPGAVLNITPGRTVDVVQPPSVREYPDYIKTVLRAIATGLGVTYEHMTGSYEEMNFSSSRASHIEHWERVEDWRWMMLIPQFCDPAWAWAMQSALIMRRIRGAAPAAKWSPPPRPMVNPVDEGLAYQRNIRNGIQTWPEMVRERGYDPEEQIAEIAEWQKKIDAAGVTLDCDARKTTMQGQLQTEKPDEDGAEESSVDNKAAPKARVLRRA